MPNRWEQIKIPCCECVGFEAARRQLPAAGCAGSDLAKGVSKHAFTSLIESGLFVQGLNRGPNGSTFILGFTHSIRKNTF